MLPDTRFLRSVLGEPLGLEIHLDVASSAIEPEALSRGERRTHRALAHTPRARSWLLGRAALKRLRASLEGRSDTDDLAFPDPRYSLTHSAELALAVAEPSGSLEGIGVDLEIGTRIRPAAARFFLTGREREWLHEVPDEARESRLLRLWCVKEALYKANPGNAGTILSDHELLDPARAVGAARTRRGGTLEYASWLGEDCCVALAVCR